MTICKQKLPLRSRLVGAAVSLAGVLLAIATGCGDDGPRRYELSGAVTYNGQPVPRGYIIFTPDSDGGNPGPGTQVEIVDGRYTATAGEGTIGGKHRVTITGFDGQTYQDGPVTNPNGRLLFSDLQQTVDLPKTASQHDFSLSK